MNQDTNTTRVRRVIFFICLSLLILIGWLLYSSISTRGTVVVSLEKEPFDSKVSLGGVEIKGNSIRLKPGTYVFSVSRDGFYKKDITATIDMEGRKSAALLLNPQTEAAKKLVADDKKYHYDHSTGAGEVFDPLFNYLPIKNSLFTVDSDARKEVYPDPPYTLRITASKGYRNAAIQALQDKNLDPSDYTYDFPNYKEPF